jgi:succinate dehydrogenase / fumarate reductase cytochrome b subunit
MAAIPSRERLKRIHSLCGAFPLAAFVVLHLWTNATAIWGRDRFEARLGWFAGLPGSSLLELVGIALPLVLHVGIGIHLMGERTDAARAEQAPRDWGRWLQRATGVAGLVFVAVHLLHYRWPRLTGGLQTADLYDRLVSDLQGMGRFAFYLAGTSVVVFHLAHGLARFAAPVGPSSSPTRRRRVAVLCGTFGVLLWLVSLEVLGNYYAGGSVLGSLGVLHRLAPGAAGGSP